MSVAGKVKEFIETCPFLEEFEQATFPVVNMDLLEFQFTTSRRGRPANSHINSS